MQRHGQRHLLNKGGEGETEREPEGGGGRGEGEEERKREKMNLGTKLGFHPLSASVFVQPHQNTASERPR